MSTLNCLALVTMICWLPLHSVADDGSNILPEGSFEGVNPTYVPWAGVDNEGNIHGLEGHQLKTDDDGTLRRGTFGPSVAVADLNEDAKPDLVVADSMGFFWFYRNSGTPQHPVFTQGEVIPIWVGEERKDWGESGFESVVPRIQLVDFNGKNCLDILAGTFAGKLFHIPNLGTPAQPAFKPVYNLDAQLIDTRKEGALWCNYLAPCMTKQFGASNSLDLIMGEGTYSANSIYLLRNLNSASAPAFNEDHTLRVIPGMGLEHLTPVVLDWNNDGKPDILCGDRTGYLNLYLNNSTDPNNPTFAPGVHVKIGGIEKIGNDVTVSIGDLTGNHLPNLLIGKDDGTILYARNTGTLGSPAFNTPAAPLKGLLPPNYRYTSLTAWDKSGAWGAPDELLSAVNPQLEPGFTFPDGVTSKYAMKFSVWPVPNPTFTERYYPLKEEYFTEHCIGCRRLLPLKLNKKYRIHFWIKANGTVSEPRFLLEPVYGSNDRGLSLNLQALWTSLDAGPTWTEVSAEVSTDAQAQAPKVPPIKTWNYNVQFRFHGQSTFYIDDLQIHEEL
jgi:hypothetical protein